MRRIALLTITALSLVYAAGVATLSRLPAWDALGGLPVSVAAVGCPSGPIALEASAETADAPPFLPLVLARDYHRGDESPASRESCRRIVEIVRENEPAFAYVPARFICANVRAHARELWTDADIWVDSWLWIIDGRAVGPATPGYLDALAGAGIGYALVDGRPVPRPISSATPAPPPIPDPRETP